MGRLAVGCCLTACAADMGRSSLRTSRRRRRGSSWRPPGCAPSRRQHCGGRCWAADPPDIECHRGVVHNAAVTTCMPKVGVLRVHAGGTLACGKQQHEYGRIWQRARSASGLQVRSTCSSADSSARWPCAAAMCAGELPARSSASMSAPCLQKCCMKLRPPSWTLITCSAKHQAACTTDGVSTRPACQP